MNEILSASPGPSEKAIPGDLSRIRRPYLIRHFIPHKLRPVRLDRGILSRSIKGYVDPCISFRDQITGYTRRVSSNTSLLLALAVSPNREIEKTQTCRYNFGIPRSYPKDSMGETLCEHRGSKRLNWLYPPAGLSMSFAFLALILWLEPIRLACVSYTSLTGSAQPG